MHINDGPFGTVNRSDCWSVPIPDQDISHLYIHDNIADINTIIEIYYPGELNVYQRPFQDLVIDENTGSAIDQKIHITCSTNEQIGMLRNMCVLLGNKLGIEFPVEFAAWNEIAIAEIAKGQAAKEAINEDD